MHFTTTKRQLSVGHLLLAFTLICLPCTMEGATDYNRYLSHLFHKYGNGGTMSFEGLEHLMYSLGLGQLEFEPSHTIEEHRPKGFKASDNVMNEQNAHKIMSYNEDDIQMSKTAQQTTDGLAKEEQEGSKPKDPKVVLEFKEMHDPRHRHPRENDASYSGGKLSVESNVCLSPKSLLRLVIDHDDLHKKNPYKTVAANGDANHPHNVEEEYNDFVNNVLLTPVAFMKLCPALLAQIDQHVCVRPAPLEHQEDTKQMMWTAWIYATASIFILSACGLLGILLVPLMKTVAYQEILKFLVAIAVGTLSGDALMHLLPHALMQASEDSESHHHHEEHHHESEGGHQHNMTAVWICGCAFATTVFMYILENLIPLLKSGDAAGHGHSHGGSAHNHGAPAIVTIEPPTADVKEVKELNIMLDEKKKDQKTGSRPLTPVAFMVVIGDGLHNLTDGLAIGAAFATAPITGFATAFAVLCHELPHELGDFALLLQTGVSIRRAVLLNLVSSVLSFVGMAAGLLIAGTHTNMTQWIYAATAGSFLYIALADLIPAMAAENNGEMGKPLNKAQKLKDALIQILGIIAGGLIMLVIAVNEDDLEKLFD